ncbi:cb32ca8f-6897-42e3-9a6b-2a2d087df62f [Thermothielavioides terrestris]|uniref:Cb32ca8f-6897-42e3-9a6b-2a2d087df62f n=1 Tax=Thermothielavioides terrestris TaxID=2587410 RepID=A0A3S4F7F6_9PEZI|nr:cb32ca8f-6897-42e3-9a6b-2a2d087df62f [Thermothielavioides terrestris]
MEVLTPQQAEEAPVESSAVPAETVSESDSGDEYDVLVDFSGNEADGWVPVMVAEENEGEDWMSLTGSWVLMRGRDDRAEQGDRASLEDDEG